MDKIFSDLLAGTDTFEDVILANTYGLTEASIENLFQNPGTSPSTGVMSLTEFVRKLSYESKDGAGSVIADTLGTGGTDILDDTAAIQQFRIDPAKALGLENTNVKTTTGADNAINEFKKAIEYTNNVRSYYGSIQNRLEHTIANLDNVIENTTAAESAIRDTDMAEMMVEYSNQNILLQAGQAMLAQANQQQDGILTLLRG